VVAAALVIGGAAWWLVPPMLKVEVPNLVDLDSEAATTTLEERGLELGRVEERTTGTKSAGTVLDPTTLFSY